MEKEKRLEEKMITKASLKERGWTEKLISLFLPVPDLEKPNPMYRNAGAPMRLFILTKVEALEETEEFKKEKEKAEKRKLSSKKAIRTKLEKLQLLLETIEISLPVLNKKTLIKRACNNYNNMQRQRANQGRSHHSYPASSTSEESFLNRICVNHLRHCLTNYEELLNDISGKVGFSVGYSDIRDKIFKKIIELYPWLEDECRRQNGELTIGTFWEEKEIDVDKYFSN
jgi:hypothetical protein